MNTGVGSLSLLQGNLPTQESKNQSLLHCRWILYQLSYKEAYIDIYVHVYESRWKSNTFAQNQLCISL